MAAILKAVKLYDTMMFSVFDLTNGEYTLISLLNPKMVKGCEIGWGRQSNESVTLAVLILESVFKNNPLYDSNFNEVYEAIYNYVVNYKESDEFEVDIVDIYKVCIDNTSMSEEDFYKLINAE